MKINITQTKQLFDFDTENQNDDNPKIITAYVEVGSIDAGAGRIEAVVKSEGANTWEEVGYIDLRSEGVGITLKSGITFTVPAKAKWMINNSSNPTNGNSTDFALVTQIN
jgi:hypothetical protein